MGEKGDKKLCWNCDGYVGIHLSKCPYCAASLHLANESSLEGKKVASRSFSISEEEWKQALSEKSSSQTEKKEADTDFLSKKQITAFLLLLPGIVLFFFGLVLLFFSNEKGELILRWKQNSALFYLLAASPLIYLGWRFR